MDGDPTVTNNDIHLLRVAIDEAEGWKGSLSPDAFDEFDAQIARMRRALDRVRADRKRLRKIAKAAREARR